MPWTHAICTPCWDKKNPERKPVAIREVDPETCCFCGEPTRSGIYVRHDPKNLMCKGNHD